VKCDNIDEMQVTHKIIPPATLFLKMAVSS